MKILVVDDTPVNLKILTSCCVKQGYKVITATNGREGVEAFISESPDLILMDVMMPFMDGFEATLKIKKLSKKQWVPIILVTALDNDLDIIKGIESGADDYLSTPVNLNILREKIRVMQRISEIQKNLNINLEELKEYHDKAEEELGLAKSVMEKIVGSNRIDPQVLQHWIMPAQHFSGDVIAATRTPSDKLYVCLADVAGHGLPAALIVLPISQLFYDMAEMGSSLVSIAEEVNCRINQQMPVGRFVAATLVSIDTKSRIIEVWNGGNFPAILLNRKGEIVQEFKSRHLPLGILDKEKFNEKTERYRFEQETQLFMCSDGLLEAEGKNDRFFGQERMVRVLKKEPPERRFTALVNAVRKHLDNKLAHDDVSLVAIQCRPDQSYKKVRPKAKNKTSRSDMSSPWKLSMHLGPEKIKSLSVVSLLLEWLNQMDVRKAQSRAIFVVLSELYNNALDHGLLKLDSKLKLFPNGFDQYLSERHCRLQNLGEGSICIEMSKIERDGKAILRIQIKDSGEGFDHEKIINNNELIRSQPSGRGIPLVMNLCEKVDYIGNGNEVVTHFELKENIELKTET